VNDFLTRGSWRVGYELAAFEAFLTSGAQAMQTAHGGDELWLTIESLFAISGMRPHGLVVASYQPSSGSTLTVDVYDSGVFTLDSAPQTGLLSRPLHVGLPLDFVDATRSGVLSGALACDLKSGTVAMIGGGFDSDSSPAVFDRLGRAVAWAFQALTSGSPVDAAIETAMRDW
jgi:hypothetical protein